MTRRCRYPVALGLVCVLMLMLVPAANAVPISVTCNGGGCSSNWYTSSVTVAFTWDATGVTATQNCDTATVSSDTTGWSRTCTVTYSNGSQSSLGVTVKKDGTAPSVTGASPSRGPDSNGWYNSPVGITFNGTDATSGIASCSSTTYAGPDSTNASFSGTCSDRAGNTSGSTTFGPIKYDATPPSVSVSLSRGPDFGDWYNRPVDFSASGSDNLSGIASCSGGTLGGGGSGTATCRDNAGNTASTGVGVKYDASGPSIDAVGFDRPPDSNGWYNHPVQISFRGSDGGSGIASCTAVTYAGPDTPGTTVNGNCRDNAGNSTGGTSPTFKYDSTPPTLTNVGTDWDDGTATLSWTASPDTKEVDVDRAPGKDGAASTTVYKGLDSSFEDTGLQNKVKYVYTITAYDEAGNKAVDSVTIVPGAKLYSPARGATVTSPPLLAWRAYPGATYYNLQLFYGAGNGLRRVASVEVSGRKILSAWPLQAHYRLKKTWTYKHKKRSLARGHYRWYVYPGLGKRSANKYGPLIGSSDFFVAKR